MLLQCTKWNKSRNFVGSIWANQGIVHLNFNKQISESINGYLFLACGHFSISRWMPWPKVEMLHTQCLQFGSIRLFPQQSIAGIQVCICMMFPANVCHCRLSWNYVVKKIILFLYKHPQNSYLTILQLELEFSSTQSNFFHYIPIWWRPMWMVVFT